MCGGRGEWEQGMQSQAPALCWVLLLSGDRGTAAGTGLSGRNPAVSADRTHHAPLHVGPQEPGGPHRLPAGGGRHGSGAWWRGGLLVLRGPVFKKLQFIVGLLKRYSKWIVIVQKLTKKKGS